MKIINKKDPNKKEEVVVYYDGTNLDEVNAFFGEPCVVKDGVILAPILFSLPISVGTIVCKDGMHISIEDIDRYKVVDPSPSFVRDYTRMKISKAIEGALNIRNLTKGELAELSNVHKNTVSRICSCATGCTLDNLISVLYSLGLKIEITKDASIKDSRYKGVKQMLLSNLDEALAYIRGEYDGMNLEYLYGMDIDVFDIPHDLHPVSGLVDTCQVTDADNIIVALIGWVAKGDNESDNPKTNPNMEKKLFKTHKEVEKYIETNYPGMNIIPTDAAEVEFFSDWDDAIDNAGGEVSTVHIVDGYYNSLAYLGWWEEGDDVYEIFGDDKLLGTYDNTFDAHRAFKDAKYNYDDDDQVTIKINGEEQDW